MLLYRANMDGDIISLSVDQIYLFQKYLSQHSVTLMIDEQKLTCICIVVLRTHIINYAKTRDVYAAYRKSGYSKKFLDDHREEITLHKAAKAAFDAANLKKLPKVKDLNAEYSTLMTKKKSAYPEYRKARDEMQELLRAQKNIELFFEEEKNHRENEQTR